MMVNMKTTVFRDRASCLKEHLMLMRYVQEITVSGFSPDTEFLYCFPHFLQANVRRVLLIST
jgi:hypothetical protein